LLDEYFRRPYRILLRSLLVTLVAAPVASEYQLRTWPIELLLIVNLTVAAVGYRTRWGRHWLLAVVTLTVLLRILGRWRQDEAASTGATFMGVGLFLFAAIAALRFALRGRKVDSERLSAAVSAYLLAGYCFGIAYFEVEQLRPGSLIGGTPSQPAQLDLQTAIYFSFVTLSTLGYGDISPLTPTARGIAISEAILGQLYLAVLIARLVGAPGLREGPDETAGGSHESRESR
jgi:voltage-gated potassium channel